MLKQELGQLEEVDLRDIWGDEARDFTPWLAEAENLSQLGAALNLELDLVETEGEVGSLRVDIVAESELGVVVIENQLEKTDHDHLGKLLSYAAGRDARVLVWVTPSLKDEHRAALDWLNRWTPEELEVYGVEVRIIRIGDSRPAPEFRAVAFPNTWSRQVEARNFVSSMSSEEMDVRREFFEKLVLEANSYEHVTPKSSRSAIKSKSFRSAATRESEYWVDLRANQVEVRLYIKTSDREQHQDVYDRLSEQLTEFRDQLHLDLQVEMSKQSAYVLMNVTRESSIDELPNQMNEIRDWVLNALDDIEREIATPLSEVLSHWEAEEADRVAG